MHQTNPTPNIQKLAETLRGKDELETLQTVLHWIKANLKLKHEFAKKRSRTAEELLESKTVTGCIDYALIFLSIIRALQYEATFVDCVEKTWLHDKTPKSVIRGHIFCRIRLQNKELIVDPTSGIINESGQFVRGTVEYIPIKEGLDSWDIGFMNNGDQARFLEEQYNIQFIR